MKERTYVEEDHSSDHQVDRSAAQTGSSDSDSDIKRLLRKLSDDMVSMHSALNKKIDLI